MYNFNKDSAYFDQIYYSIINGDEEKMQEYRIEAKEIAKVYKEHDFVSKLANKYYQNISQEDIDFAVKKIIKHQTLELGNVIKKLKQNGHQVVIIGGSAFGCAIIPQFAKQFGIEKSDIYSGYFKDFSETSLQKAFTFDNFEYVNCANPDIHTVYSKKKSDLIKFLKKEGKIIGKIVHIGDGENDLEVWQAKQADVFIGFGVNKVVDKVQKEAPIFVKTIDAFQIEINKIINSQQKQYNLIVYPGRFQPFHQGHYDMAKEAQKYGKHVVVAISQAKGMQKDDRNIFSVDDREKMIRDTIEKDGFKNYSIIQLDYVSKNKTLQTWDNNLIKAAKLEYKKIFKKQPKKEDIAFLYYDRDKANYDKRFEKDFDIIEVKSSFDDDISATKIRKEFFEEGKINENLPFGTKKFLENFLKKQNQENQENQKIQLAITFDDLPFAGDIEGINRYKTIEKLLKIAKKYNIPEVYGFVNGGKVKNEEDEKILKLWSENYPIGNHTLNHFSLNKISKEEYADEILKNESLVKKFSKENQDYKVFRYTYLQEGNTSEKRQFIREFLQKNNYKTAQVTIDFEDWAFANAFIKCKNKKKAKGLKKLKEMYFSSAWASLKRADKLSKILFKKPIKHILLLHASYLNAENFEELIKLYLQNSVKFISLQEAMEDEIYKINYDFPFKEGREFIYQLAIKNNINLKEFFKDEKFHFNEKDLSEIAEICG